MYVEWTTAGASSVTPPIPERFERVPEKVCMWTYERREYEIKATGDRDSIMRGQLHYSNMLILKSGPPSATAQESSAACFTLCCIEFDVREYIPC